MQSNCVSLLPLPKCCLQNFKTVYNIERDMIFCKLLTDKLKNYWTDLKKYFTIKGKKVMILCDANQVTSII